MRDITRKTPFQNNYYYNNNNNNIMMFSFDHSSQHHVFKDRPRFWFILMTHI
jgi:hypothetical protein